MSSTEASERVHQAEQIHTERPLILVCNDDGITAPGIRALVMAVAELGDVVIVAPDKAQSGMGHAVTVGMPLRLTQMDHLFEDVPNLLAAWQASGTPVDCVKLAVDKVLKRKPDLLVSGINHGSNSSINVLYSGTMSAAVEGAIEGIPSIGFSLGNYSWRGDFTLAAKIARMVSEDVLKAGTTHGTALNVNIPNVTEAEYKGLKICSQARSKYDEAFEERQDPYGRAYYWMTGKFSILEANEGSDEHALAQGFATVVPVLYDMTAYSVISPLTQSIRTQLAD